MALIERDEMMEALLDAYPSFRPDWESFLEEWKDSPNGVPHYVILADFARHLIGLLERSETANFPVIFRVIERLQEEGDEYVRGAAILGVLEALQNYNLHTVTEPEQFRPYLGPRSSAAWDELDELWKMVIAMSSPARSEAGSG